MKIDSKFMQRAILALTTGLFLSCAARVSYSQPAPSSSAAPIGAR